MKKTNKKNFKIYMRLEISFVKLIIKDSLMETKSTCKFVSELDLGGKIPLLKPFGLEGGINMEGYHIFELFILSYL